MRFVDWMEACLYDEEGYYMRPGRKTGAGEDADFATSPTLHPFMGRCIADEIVQAWDERGRPEDFAVYEFGGGEGDLARAALERWKETGHGFRWHHIERSPTHRAAQDDGSTTALAALPGDARGVVVAHEFVDALPFRWLERTQDGWAEVAVDVAGGCFVERLILTDADPGLDARAGQRVAFMEQARAWVHHVAAAAADVLVIDYGGRDVWRRSQDGTVRTFQKHQEAGSPLEAPGEMDITASVDFTALDAWASEAALDVAVAESQESFLLRHGVLEALNEIDRTTTEGASAYLRLRQMLLPTGMGTAFQVRRYKRSD